MGVGANLGGGGEASGRDIHGKAQLHTFVLVVGNRVSVER